MISWSIPAKTFLLGEYAALGGESAIIVTTVPCFKLSLAKTPTTLIHPNSPAGIYWQQTKHPHGLVWHDPYLNRGGLGASSAQFLGAFLANCYLSNTNPDVFSLLVAYHQCAWSGNGIRPSGYDVLAQSQNCCVYIDYQQKTLECLSWPFKDISFILIHTGQKLATHHYLQTMHLTDAISTLASLVKQARFAFQTQDSALLITTITDYQHILKAHQLTAEHSVVQLNQLTLNPAVLAVKGCGAMGADVLLVVVSSGNLTAQVCHLRQAGWPILATSDDLFTGLQLIKNNMPKTLEILP
jgi:mevalonate kinase